MKAKAITVITVSSNTKNKAASLTNAYASLFSKMELLSLIIIDSNSFLVISPVTVIEDVFSA